MKTITRRMKFRYFIRESLYFPITSFLLAGCRKETPLSDQGVAEAGAVECEKTESDKWILDTFTLPYGIEVEYRWDKNTVQNGSYIYPPEVANIRGVLEAIKALRIGLYTSPDLEGERFLLRKNPLKIYMYGGRNADGNGVRLLDNPEATTSEMFLYNINELDPKDEDKVFALVRSVHRQFAGHFIEFFPYDRNNFLSISKNKYAESTTPIAWIFKRKTRGRRVFALVKYANRKNFFTYHSLLLPEKDFAEIISSKLTHTPKDILKTLTEAKTPYATGSDQNLQDAYNEQAVWTYKELTGKQKLVEDYFNEEIKVSLNHLQLRSIKQLKAFTKQK